MIQPRHVLCVLGGKDWLDAARRVVSGFGNGFWLDTDYSIEEPDSRMPQAFEASFDRVAPSFADEDVQAIRDHQAVAYVLSPHMTSTTAPQMSELALKLIGELLMAGGVAAKSDSCGIAHGRTQWLGLAKSVAGEARDRLAALHIAWVRRPLSDREVLHSCGMHLLGCPDIELTAGSSEREAVTRMDDLALRMLAAPVSRGETKLTVQGVEHEIRHTQCTRYASDDFYYNPFGYIRVLRSRRVDA